MTSDTVLAQLQSDHLFLLMGTNPLPNLVAAKLLLKAGGYLHLVCSEATRPAAERLLRYWVEDEKGHRPQVAPVPEADGIKIQATLSKEMEGLKKHIVGVNYTGGTKIMAIAAYLAAQQTSSHTNPFILSYLDARSNRMIINKMGMPTTNSGSVLFSLNPAPTIEQIIQLHAIELVSEIERESVLPDLAMELAKVHLNGQRAHAWRTWCDELKARTQTKKRGTYDSEGQLKEVIIELPGDERLGGISRSLQSRFGTSSTTINLGPAREHTGFRDVKHLCKWLDGIWLEYYVLNLLEGIRKNKPACQIGDLGMGIKPRPELDRSEFEVDIGVMQGYRLYAISCTTSSDPSLCKAKLLEAYERARNMGGDEAFVGLVCCSEKPDQLERQVGRSWDIEGKVRVFGRSHLQRLDDHLAEWFESSIRDRRNT